MSNKHKNDANVDAARVITAAIDGARVHINGVFHAGEVPIRQVGGIITSGQIALAALSHAGFKVVREDPSEAAVSLPDDMAALRGDGSS
jgi:hypothetical protein